MASFNRVILMGNLTRDPELRYIQSGTAVTELDLAVNDRRKSATGEWIEETTYINRRDGVGPPGGNRWRIPDQGLARALRRPLEAGHMGKQGRPKAFQARGYLQSRMQMVGGRAGGQGGGQGGDRPQGGQRPAQRGGGASQYNQSGPPEYSDEPSPAEMSGGGGDDIPF